MENAIDSMVVDGKTVRNALVAVFFFFFGAAMPSFAADWTDANDITYTALKSINGGGSGLIVTDFTPAGTEIIKFKYKPLTVSGNECVFCSRYYANSQPKAQFSGFRIGNKLRFDRCDYYTSGKTAYPRQSTCNTTTLSAGEEYCGVVQAGSSRLPEDHDLVPPQPLFWRLNLSRHKFGDAQRG